MDKYEYTVKVEKIKKLADGKDYVGAAKIADAIDWSRVKDVRLLSMVADVYDRNRRYADAKDVLLCAYEIVPEGRRLRNVLYRLTELAIKEGNPEEAVDFFEEFRKEAPSDPGQYILCYQMAVAQGEPIEKQIALLEAYKKKEPEEKWLLELARLYGKAGNGEACVRVCDEMMLWFGYDRYVEKAMELKRHFAELTPSQEEMLSRGRAAEAEEAQARGQMQTVKKTKSDKVTKMDKASRGAKAAREQAERETAATAERAKREDRPRKAAGRSEKVVHRMDRVAEIPDVQEVPEWSEPRYVEQPVQQVQTEEPRARQLEDLLAEAKLKAELFDEAGFALDLPKPAMLKTREQATVSVEEVGEICEVEMMPQIDLACVREAVEETTHQTEGVSESLEDILKELGAPEEETGSTLAAAVAEIVAEEAVPAVEPMLEMAAAAEPETAEAPVEAELEALSALLKETVQEEAAEVQQPAEEVSVPAAEEEPVAEEPEKDMPIFACVLMETSDAEELVPKAVDLIKRTHARLGTQASQAAKVTGAKLNKKGIKSSLERLNGRDLIVESAGALERPVLLELVEALRSPAVGGVIVLADAVEALHGLIDCCPEIVDVSDYEEAAPVVLTETAEELARKEQEAKRKAEEELRLLMEERAKAEAERKAAAEAEKKAAEEAALAEAARERAVEEEAALLAEEEAALLAAVAAPAEEETKEEPEEDADDGKPLTTEQFVKYIEVYTAKLECVIDSKARLAICEIAEQMKEDGEELTRASARELADDAIYLAEKPSLRGLLSKKYDKEGYLILKEQHFCE